MTATKVIPSLVIACVLVATSVFFRPKTTDVTTLPAVSLILSDNSDYCQDTDTYNHAETLQADNARGEVYFVGCGGFF